MLSCYYEHNTIGGDYCLKFSILDIICEIHTFQISLAKDLSDTLNRSKIGYYIGKQKESNLINHLLFMDDLKIYASNDNQLNTLINITKLFSDDIKMAFGFDKCKKITIIRGKLTSTGDISLNEDDIKELNGNRTYVYLGISERDKIFKKDLKIELKKRVLQKAQKDIIIKIK